MKNDQINWTEPAKLRLQNEIPDVFAFLDGRKVENAADWKERSDEIKRLYEYYMYGPLPDGSEEKVCFRLGDIREVDEEVESFDGTKLHARARVCDMEIQVDCQGRADCFPCVITLPWEGARDDGYPVYLEMQFVFGSGGLKPSLNAYYAAERGYAAISWEPVRAAADNGTRSGAFYTMHPYGENWEQQTGVLAAWGWSASKILDALAMGAAAELQINWANNILSGVSRYGKAVLVAGAYDRRIKVVVPACSGAGGVAMYRCRTEGIVYDLTELGYVGEDGSGLHVTTENEPLGSLQSTDERHWFNDRFLEFDCVERFPFDQHHLAALSADRERYLFIIASAFGEDWTNPAAMYKTYEETRRVYEFLGIAENICMDIHLKGHAVLLSDMVKLLDYCEVKLYGEKPENVETDLGRLRPESYCPVVGE